MGSWQFYLGRIAKNKKYEMEENGMKKENVLKVMDIFRERIITYEYNGFLIELYYENYVVECWLRHPDYGIAMQVMGASVLNDYVMDMGVTKFYENFIREEIEYYIADYIGKYAQELEYE